MTMLKKEASLIDNSAFVYMLVQRLRPVMVTVAATFLWNYVKRNCCTIKLLCLTAFILHT